MRKKHSIKSWLLLLLIGLGIGYAFLMTKLGTSGVAHVEGNTWSVYWDNVVVDPNSVSGTQVTTAAHLVGDTKVELNVTLNEPGDFYAFSIDVKNEGSIDAMIDEIVLNDGEEVEHPDYLDLVLLYGDTLEIDEKQLLKAGSTEKYFCYIGFSEDVENDDLSSNTEEFSISIDIKYKQADSTAKEIRPVSSTTNYYYSSGIFNFLHEPPDDVPFYSSAADAMSAIDRPFYVQNKVINNQMVSSTLGFVYNDQTYTFDSTDTSSYEQIKNRLETIFDGNCITKDADYNDDVTICGDSNSVKVAVYEKGTLAAGYDGLACGMIPMVDLSLISVKTIYCGQDIFHTAS